MKLCCLINPMKDLYDQTLQCIDCKGTVCSNHMFKKRASNEMRCLKCFRKQILSHRVGKRR